MRASALPIFLMNFSRNTTYLKKLAMAGSISKFSKVSMAFPNLERLPTTYLSHAPIKTDTTKLPQHLAFGFTSGDLFYSLSLSMTLALNTSAYITPFTSATSSHRVTP